MKLQAEKVWVNCKLVTMADRNNPLKIIESGAIAMANGKILAADEEQKVLALVDCSNVEDMMGRLATPGLIDCHTHLVYAGNRANEFEARLEGESYAQIAANGGGILSTLHATRNASEDELLAQTLPRLDQLIKEGVTTVEIKSGYGQNIDSELKQLRVARHLAKLRGIDVSVTLLAAHVVPPEFKGNADDYIQYICDELIPAALEEGNVDAIDAFCEHIAFNVDQVAKVFDCATHFGIKVKLHAGQLSDSGGVALAARYQALSADHLEFATLNAVKALSAAGTVAVILPGAFYCLRETQKPPIQMLRDYQVPIAVATDANPGTSPLTSPLLAMNMVCTFFNLTVAEAFMGMTCNAAAALGLQHEIGTIEIGKYCNLTFWDADSPAEIIYQLGFNPLYRRIWRGQEHV